jgi:ATP-dependent RNA helicase RhlE
MKSTAHAARKRTHNAPLNLESVTLEGAFSTLIPELRKALVSVGYNTPTPIQKQCIPHLLEGRDLLGTAQTGTGKTAAFVLPLLQRLAATPQIFHRNAPRALILAPTRELAAQINDSIRNYGRFLRPKHLAIFGGVSQFHQVRTLNRGVDILVATPGRLLDLMGQGYIRLDEVEVFILDEVDRMLDMGFLPDIKRIMDEVPHDRQTLFFSATMAPKMESLANTMVRNPVRVSIAPEKPTVDRITQKVLYVGREDKNALLVSVLEDPAVKKAIVFTQMKHAANRVVTKLKAAGIRGEAIHGNKSQGARTAALSGFKRGRFQVLVATDVAARGLDVDDITHVINYDLPTEAETYVHRIGRTARAGAGGDAISFCTVQDKSQLRDIERLLGQSVEAEVEHDFHCEAAMRSTGSAPRSRRGGRWGGAPRVGSGAPGRRQNSFAAHSSRGGGRPRR